MTFEVLERAEQKDGRELRILRASEIHAETILEEAEPDIGEEASTSTPSAGQFDEYGLPITTEKSNVNIIDNTENQKLTYAEIEALKSEPLTNPKDLIAMIKANHSQIDQKTAFSLAKYNLRKQKKYMRRFTVLPLDVATLTDWMMNEKDFTKVMEMRNETLGLMGSWANVFTAPEASPDDEPRCRYLVVDDTSGLVTAAIAERMGLLHYQKPSSEVRRTTQQVEERPSTDAPQEVSQTPTEPPPKRPRYEHPPATSNTITLVHANQQPNLSLLRYFGFDPTQKPAASDPTPHPLYTHLNTLTWLQLLQPESDATYAQEPPTLPADEIAKMKANHRSDYFRKRRRWTRTQQIVNTAREGQFNALIIASATSPVSICKHLVPLLAGGAQVVVYNHHIEPLMELCDVYSTARRAAYLQWRNKRMQVREDEEEYVKVESVDTDNEANTTDGVPKGQAKDDEEEARQFPVDPTLLLTPTLHHSVARPWQVLPGRTHPMMMGKGGAEGGYVMVSTRVIPIEGVAVQARGRQGKNRKKRTDEQQSGEKRQKLSVQPEEDGGVKTETGDVMDEEREESDVEVS